jgi:hypothetical protein
MRDDAEIYMAFATVLNFGVLKHYEIFADFFLPGHYHGEAHRAGAISSKHWTAAQYLRHHRLTRAAPRTMATRSLRCRYSRASTLRSKFASGRRFGSVTRLHQ